MLSLMRSLEACVSQAIEAAGHVLEPLMAAYQDAMSCVHALCTWLADDYLINMQDMTHDVEASSCRQPNAAMMGERTAFGRVLSLLGSLATSHTVDLRPGVINVVYKSLIKVLDTAASLLPSPGFWTACFDGQLLAASMLHTVDAALGELFVLSPGPALCPLLYLHSCSQCHAPLYLKLSSRRSRV